MSTIPMIQKPVGVTVGQNVSYTVPEDRIARVTCTLSVTNQAYVTPNTTNAGTQNLTGNANSVTETAQLILRAGDILSSNRSTESGTSAVSGGAFGFRATQSYCILLVNTLSSLTVRAAASLSIKDGGSSGSLTINTVGVSDMSFFAEEYYE